MRHYIDRTSTRNDFDITGGQDQRDGKDFKTYTATILAAITANEGVTIRALKDVDCPHRDKSYWLNMALHELKCDGKISERGVTFTRFYLKGANK